MYLLGRRLEEFKLWDVQFDTQKIKVGLYLSTALGELYSRLF